MVQTLIDTVIRLALLAVPPLVWWIVTARKKRSFFAWSGLKRPHPTNWSRFFVIAVIILALLLTAGTYMISAFEGKTHSATARFADLGASGILPVLLYSLVETSFCEELFFRGFLLKRLTHRFGFDIGNGVQAGVFALFHGVLLIGQMPFVVILVVMVFTGAAGWLMGHLNEVLCGGSIIPSLVIQAVVNFLMASVFWSGALPA